MFGHGGSPPLSREGLSQLILVIVRAGITPALAGRTHFCSREDCPCWDHPRSRGKDFSKLEVFFAVQGSPPLSREGLISLVVNGWLAGITPALAGRTRFSWMNSSHPEDHPRSRGKDQVVEDVVRVLKGSPPLSREGQLRIPLK